MLAEQRERNRRNGNKPLIEFGMLRIASHTVADYYRGLKRNGKVISLNTEIEDREGDTVELIDTLADDRAIDLDTWIDAKTYYLNSPEKVRQVVRKRLNGEELSSYGWKLLKQFRDGSRSQQKV